MPPLDPCPVAVLVVVLPPAPEAAIGPTTQVVAPPTGSGSVNVHEAVLAQAHDDYPEGVIVAVLERGYLLHGRLLRPARVIVAR